MTEKESYAQDGYGGFSPTAYGAPAPYAPPPAPVLPSSPPPVRPLSTGEVLDRTFTLYRSRFWLFAGIGCMPALVMTLTSVSRMVYVAVTHHADAVRRGAPIDVFANTMSTIVLLQVYLLPLTLLFLVAYGVSQAATAEAVAAITRGEQPAAASAYRTVRGRWLRWTGITLRQFWSAAWPTLPVLALMFGPLLIPGVRSNNVLVGALFACASLLMLGSFTWGVINYIRNSLAVPAALEENLGVNAAMRRSKLLVAGRKGRIFLALLLTYALNSVAGGIQLPFLLLAARAHGAEQIVLQASDLLVQFIGITLVTPVASIALCLFYIDERVRREGYDIELLMQRSFAPAVPLAVAAPEAEAPPLA